MGDRVAVMRAGELQQIAPPQELYNQPANIFVASFIGSPAMNIFHTQLQRTDGTYTINFGGQMALDLAMVDKYKELGRYINQPILAGLRPEAFFLADANTSKDRCLQIEVKAVEALGYEKIVYVNAPVSKIEVEDSRDGVAADGMDKNEGHSILITRLPSSRDAQTDAKLTLGVDTGKLYLFTADGKAIE